MNTIKVTPLRSDLAFGSRVGGVTGDVIKDEGVRQQLRDTFESRGIIVFEDVEPSSALQIEISKIFGPLKPHPVKLVEMVDPDAMPGLMQVKSDPKTCDLVEIDGTIYSNWLPWHFDHCYNNELMRGGVLRILESAPSGGLTGFLDGVDLYKSLSPDLLSQIEKHSIIYTMDMHFGHMRFGKPASFRLVQEDPVVVGILDQARETPRAIHPAVWTRASGEKVLHVSAWMAVGIEEEENPEGDALLEEVCQEILKLSEMRAYYHQWRPTDMVIWDNWRMLHSVTGVSPPHLRTMNRSTVKGDYGLGRFERNDQGHYEILERSV